VSGVWLKASVMGCSHDYPSALALANLVKNLSNISFSVKDMNDPSLFSD